MRELNSIANDLKNIASRVKSSEALNLADAVLNSLNTDKFYLAVLGEFKRGKSTLINSLLAQNLLTTDVLPATAVITIIDYSVDEKCVIHWLDNSKPDIVLRIDELNRFAIQGDIDTSLVKFVEVKIKNDLLKDGLTIIDTPGVNDISKTRIEITNNILPYCDAALFLLDAVAPVTKSEGDFLVTKILSNKLNTLLFIISKSDRLDEDELEESVAGAQERLQDILKREMKVLAYSSKNAMKASSDNQIDLQKQNLISNIYNLRKLAQTCKRDRNIERLCLCADIIDYSLGVWKGFLETSEEEIKKYKEKFEFEQTEYNLRLEQLITSINKVGRETLVQMFEKSLNEYKDKITSDFSYQLRLQDGNVEKMFKQVIPIQIEKSLKHFSETKAEEIKNYLLRFNKHLIMEYEKNFSISLILNMKEHSISLPEWVSNSNSYTTENATNKIIKGTLPYLAGAVVTSVLLPHLAVAALIGGTLTGAVSSIHSLNNNERLKEQYLSKLSVVVDEIFSNYKEQSIDIINLKFDQLIKILKEYHSKQVDSINQKIRLKLGTEISNKEGLSDSEIGDLKNMLYKLKLELELNQEMV